MKTIDLSCTISTYANGVRHWNTKQWQEYAKKCSVESLAVMNRDCKKYYGERSALRTIFSNELLTRYRIGVNKRFPDDIVIEKSQVVTGK